MSNPNWEQQGIKPNESRSRDSFDNGTLIINYNEVTLYVIWYEKINVDSNKLKFCIC